MTMTQQFCLGICAIPLGAFLLCLFLAAIESNLNHGGKFDG